MPMKNLKSTLLSAALALSCLSAFGDNVPDVLMTSDGQPVTTRRMWERTRRAEVFSVMESQMYGKAPGRPSGMSFEVLSEGQEAYDGAARKKVVRIWFDGGRTLGETLELYVPSDARGKVPVFVGVNFVECNRGNLGRILSSGFGFATLDRQELSPDSAEHYREGVIDGLGPGDGDPHSWGCLAAWAWGLSRALDYLETDPAVDGRRVCVFGHSRTGKAALWAGAADTRFAMVIANASGCGGAALSRLCHKETVRAMTRRFPYWCCANYKAKYGESISSMDFDQHWLLALIAPRPLCIGSAAQDRYVDAPAQKASFDYARPVWELYGRKALRRMDYHERQGDHAVLPEDWDHYFEMAEKYLLRGRNNK